MALSGKHYTVGASPPGYMPWHDTCSYGTFRNCSRPGIDPELLLAMSHILNFTFQVEVLRPPENVSNEDATWDDYFAYYLSNNQIDFTMNSLSLVAGLQEKGVQFAAPLIYTDRGFMIRQPNRDLRFLLSKPFSREVWWCLLGSATVLALLSAIVWTPQNKKKTDQGLMFVKEYHPGIQIAHYRQSSFLWIRHMANNVWTIGMIMLQQSLPPSYYLQSRPYTQKLLIAVWVIGSFVLTASYSAMLISVLLDIKPDLTPFRNIKDLTQLIKHRGYRTIISAGEREGFKAWMAILAERPQFQDYADTIRRYPPEVVPTFDDVVNRVLNDHYLVYPCRLVEVQYRIQNVRCNISFIPSWEESHPTGPGFASSFSELEAFSRAFLTMGSGIFDNIKEIYIPSPICDPPPTDMSLSTNQLQGGFWLMGVGGLMAVLAFATESFLKAVRKLEEKRKTV